MTVTVPSGRPAARPAASSSASAEWSAEVHRDEQALIALADDLRDLYDRSPAATPFQAYEWIKSWWGWYGTRGRLRLATVRCRGRLVAAAPMAAGVRHGFPVLVPISADQSDFTDVLLDPDYTDGAVRHLARALLDERGWCALDLREVRPGSAAHLVAAQWPRRAWRTPSSVCLELPAGDGDAGIDAVLDRLPRRTAGKMRAKLRKIDVRGITAERVPADRVPDAVHALLDLHARQWRGRPINPEHTRGRFRRHLAEAATGMVRDGRAAVLQYRWDDRLVASDLVLIGHRHVGAYLYGALPDLRSRVDVSLMMLREDLALARDRDRQGVSLLRGDEPYKLKWRPTPVRNERIILGRTASAAAYAGLARTRAYLAERRRGGPGAHAGLSGIASPLLHD
ncbi:GNAT family N-acetyltransferase [Actinomadura mexicana]|uniref:Acetyltransferase involved in cellulose biosynthesis, CelD/BcsL family n=1 Tax=Actinomadura mexicana TaxID=134959 RepID=A0A239CQT4_9ACTN|nr:GNAT family N-acetyltransferase [Actinomadura mexicana]SNS21864.1 Acetyltransferase involved in cellulose biosynthesis, CelD/BcsL family [Actinomadura mexicana]